MGLSQGLDWIHDGFIKWQNHSRGACKRQNVEYTTWTSKFKTTTLTSPGMPCGHLVEGRPLMSLLPRPEGAKNGLSSLCWFLSTHRSLWGFLLRLSAVLSTRVRIWNVSIWYQGCLILPDNRV